MRMLWQTITLTAPAAVAAVLWIQLAVRWLAFWIVLVLVAVLQSTYPINRLLIVPYLDYALTYLILGVLGGFAALLPLRVLGLSWLRCFVAGLLGHLAALLLGGILLTLFDESSTPWMDLLFVLGAVFSIALATIGRLSLDHGRAPLWLALAVFLLATSWALPLPSMWLAWTLLPALLAPPTTAPEQALAAVQPPSVAGLLDAAARRLRASAGVLIACTALPFLAVIPLLLLRSLPALDPWFLLGSWRLLSGAAGVALDALLLDAFFLPGAADQLLTYQLTYAVSAAIGSAALIRATASAAAGQPHRLWDTFRLPRMGLVRVLVLLLLPVAAGNGLVLLADHVHLPALLTLITGSAGCCLISIVCVFAPQAIVLEQTTLPAAIRRSWQLTTGAFWQIADLLIIGHALPVLVVLVPLIAIHQGILDVIVPLPALNDRVTLLLWGAALSAIQPVPVVLTTLLFADRRLAHAAAELARAGYACPPH